MSQTDQEKWERVLEGQRVAWCELVDTYKDLVTSVARRMGLVEHEARDCFQQTWLALYQRRAQIRQPEKIASWLATTARNEALRLRSRRQPTELREPSVELVDPAPLADEELERLERKAQLDQALGEIDGKCQKLLKAIFYAPEDWSYKRLASSLNVSVNSMGSNRQRCLEKLKSILLRYKFLEERNMKIRTVRNKKTGKSK